MIVSLIVAMDRRGGIGLAGRLPWRLSSDLKRFKNLTMGHHLVMGRKTWEAIGRPLPGRINIVVTHQSGYQPAYCLISHSLEEALEQALKDGESEVFVIGGGEIFTQALYLADKVYLTEVQAELNADVFFPAVNWDGWVVVEAITFPASEKDQYPYVYTILEKLKTS